MEQVGRPDQSLPQPRREALRLQLLCCHRRLPVGMKVRLVARLAILVSQPHITGLEIGQAMTAWEILQWPCIGMNIFQRHPDTTHEPRWLTMEVHSITVNMLLGTNRKVEGLKRNRHPPPEQLQQLLKFRQ